MYQNENRCNPFKVNPQSDAKLKTVNIIYKSVVHISGFIQSPKCTTLLWRHVRHMTSCKNTVTWLSIAGDKTQGWIKVWLKLWRKFKAQRMSRSFNYSKIYSSLWRLQTQGSQRINFSVKRQNVTNRLALFVRFTVTRIRRFKRLRTKSHQTITKAIKNFSYLVTWW